MRKLWHSAAAAIGCIGDGFPIDTLNIGISNVRILRQAADCGVINKYKFAVCSAEIGGAVKCNRTAAKFQFVASSVNLYCAIESYVAFKFQISINGKMLA